MRRGPSTGAAAATLLLLTLAATVGLGVGGWGAGLAVTAAGALLLRRAMDRRALTRLGPADRVTVLRGVLAVGVTALVVDGWGLAAPAPLLLLAAVALALDAVDGWVARRGAASSRFGAALDMETDAFLILVLSLHVASTTAWWALAIGLARYAFGLAGLAWPWLRAETPPRYWAKVVAAVQGIALLVVAAGPLPPRAELVALVASLLLLAESFGHQVLTLRGAGSPRAAGVAGRLHRGASAVLTAVSFALLWVALVLPADLRDMGPGLLVLIPLEGLLLLALALVLPRVPGWGLALAAGLPLGVVVVVELVDLAFDAVFDRPVDPVNDWVYLGPGLEVLATSVGRTAAAGAAVVVALAAVAVLALVPALLARTTRAARRHRRATTAVLCVLTVLWVVAAGLDWRATPRTPVASWNAAERVYDKVALTGAALADRPRFARAIAADPLVTTPPRRLLSGLRGKDVLLVFVESYGRAALEDHELSSGVTTVLDEGEHRLAAAGFRGRSAFLTSPTYGAASWLAHATLQSGLWVDSQHRYNQLLSTDRLTLTRIFGDAGWRTLAVAPANTKPWPEGRRFYGFDGLYDRSPLGYTGPAFAFDSVPDQFTLSVLQRRELAPADRRPVMAMVDLVSSHHPWTPRPPVVAWEDVGDGAVFETLPASGETQEAVFDDSDAVRAAYADSIEYAVGTLLSFVETYGTDDLVVVMVGDHQPHSYVSGVGADHDVPVSLLARDPAVLRRIRDWGWEPGLSPSPAAPLDRMDTFRDRFLAAFR